MSTQNKKYAVKRKLCMWFGVAVVACAGCIFVVQDGYRNHATAAVPANVVYRNGSKLMLNGAPYQFVGYDAFGITGCEGSAWSRTQLDNYFAGLPPASMTRLWATQQYGTGTLDQVVASAEAHNQKVIMTLNNDLNDCVSDGAKTSAWYSSGYKNGTFLAWVKQLSAKYKDSPAIGMWEVINEAGQAESQKSGGGAALDGTVMKNFYQDVASTIKANDPNHLVGTGDIAEYIYNGGATGYKTASSAPDIDVMGIHDYESDYISNAPVVSSHFAPAKSAADSLAKPIIIGEMNDSACSVSKSTRAANVKKSIDSYLSAGAAGVLVWNFSQSYYSQCPGEDYIITPSDPLYTIIKGYTIPGNVVTPPATGGGGTTPPPTPTPTGCTIPSNYGAVAQTVTVPTTGSYRIWSRIMAPDTINNSYALDIDGTSCAVVGDSNTIPANAWTWVNYKDGTVGTPISVTLTAGSHTLKIIGREAGVKVDRVLALADTACVPSSTGNNCTASADATAPITTITSPASGATVSGVVTVAATATDNIAVTRVEIYADNTLKTALTAAPYTYQWNTGALANGPHSISVKAYDAAGNVGAATAVVTVANGDSQAPTMPTGVVATANAYNKVTLAWGASSDNVGVSQYLVTRNGIVVGSAVGATTYVDMSVAPGTTYSYQVTAYDAAGNKSVPSGMANVTTPAAPVVDTQKPSTPVGVLATPVSTSQINVTWAAATDNIGVTAYEVYRAAPSALAAKVATVSSTTFGDSGLQSNTTYTYYIVARDAAGNQSAQSLTASATTFQPVTNTHTGTLRGTVSGAQGRPLAGASVILWSSDGRQYTASTNTAGVYRFDNLPAGWYAANFHAWGYRDRQVYPGISSGKETVQNIQLSVRQTYPWWQIWR